MKFVSHSNAKNPICPENFSGLNKARVKGAKPPKNSFKIMDKNTVAKSINVTQQLIIMNAKFSHSSTEFEKILKFI